MSIIQQGKTLSKLSLTLKKNKKIMTLLLIIFFSLLQFILHKNSRQKSNIQQDIQQRQPNIEKKCVEVELINFLILYFFYNLS